MGLVRKTITVTEQQEAWIRAQVDGGVYANDSEYIRALIRRDQDARRVELETIKRALRAALEGGARSVAEIMEGVESRLRTEGKQL
jgi:antitoxin ParD1/3/4